MKAGPKNQEQAFEISRSPLLPSLLGRRFQLMVQPAFDIEHLTITERFELIERLWDSLRSRVGSLPMSVEEQQLIETRRSAHRDDPAAAIPWEAVRAELAADQEADEQKGRGSGG